MKKSRNNHVHSLEGSKVVKMTKKLLDAVKRSASGFEDGVHGVIREALTEYLLPNEIDITPQTDTSDRSHTIQALISVDTFHFLRDLSIKTEIPQEIILGELATRFSLNSLRLGVHPDGDLFTISCLQEDADRINSLFDSTEGLSYENFLTDILRIGINGKSNELFQENFPESEEPVSEEEKYKKLYDDLKLDVQEKYILKESLVDAGDFHTTQIGKLEAEILELKGKSEKLALPLEPEPSIDQKEEEDSAEIVKIDLDEIESEEVKEYLEKFGFEENRYMTAEREKSAKGKFEEILKEKIEELKSGFEKITTQEENETEDDVDESFHDTALAFAKILFEVEESQKLKNILFKVGTKTLIHFIPIQFHEVIALKLRKLNRQHTQL